MAGATLILTANQTGKSITILNGTSQGTVYSLIADDGTDWGNAEWATTFGGSRGRLGPRPAFAVTQSRTVKLHLRVAGAGIATTDQAALACQAVALVYEDVRRFGGTLTWKSPGSTYRSIFDLLTVQGEFLWTGNNPTLLRPEMQLTFSAAPYAQMDPMDTVDGFDTDTIAAGNWTKDGAGAATISAGTLHLSSSTTLTRYRHSLKGYALGDVEVTLKVTTSPSVTSCVWGVTAKADPGGADTLIAAELVAGTNVIRVRKYVAGTGTDLATAAFTPAASTTYWVRLRIEGTKATAEVYTSAPTPVATAAASAIYTKTAAEAAQFASGHTGFRITGITSDLIDDWSSMPYTYKLTNAPEHQALVGTIPGDAAAQADVQVTPFGGGASPVFAMICPLERPQVNNLVSNGDFESSVIGVGGWVATAVSGVIGAATSVARDTTAARVKYGSADMQVVCPATTDTGASFLIYRRFRRSCTYAMLAWVSSAAASTAVRCKLGVSGDVAQPAGGMTLSTTPKPISVIWQPTADRDFAYAAVGITAATATTMNVDGVVVVENPTIVALSANASSGATSLTVYSTPTDLPTAPFLALIDQELFLVTATTGTTWTVVPGVENSTQTTHATGAQIVILPPQRRELEGAGAFEPMDIIEAESYVPALSSVTGTATIGTSSDYRGGNVIGWTGMTAGATGVFVWPIDPALILADDYSLGEVDVEVWLRYGSRAAVSSLQIDVTCLPEGGATKGAQRLTRETDSKLRSIPSGGTALWRFDRIGTIPMVADKGNALRWLLRLAVTPGVADPVYLDYLMLVPSRYTIKGPTKKVNDVAISAGAYPPAIPYDSGWTTGSAMTKTFVADGAGRIAELGKPAFPDHGLGRVFELPNGDVDVLTKLSNLVPGDPTVDATNEAFTGAPSYAHSTHYAVTPRMGLIRGS